VLSMICCTVTSSIYWAVHITLVSEQKTVPSFSKEEKGKSFSYHSSNNNYITLILYTVLFLKAFGP
jgi:hypothetical protein